MTDREQLIRMLQDAVWPYLAHDPYKPDVFWNSMAVTVEDHFAPLLAEARREAAAQALREAADLLAPFSGIGMANGATRAEVSQWLRERADKITKGDQ